MRIQKVKTPQIKQAFEVSGPEAGEPLFLVHGWPDSPRTWDGVLSALHAAGYRTVVPYLRSYGPSTFRTRILASSPRHTGQPVAYAQDMLDLADHLRLKRFHFIGHDWGARTAYALAGIAPQRLKSLVTISVPFEPGKAVPPKFPQAQAFWYQWLLCTVPGEKKFRADPVAFGRAQWDAWSPTGWYTEADFAEASKSWKGTAFADVVLHAYRSRWGMASLDPAYKKRQARFESTKTISIPTTLLHGVEDSCELVATTDGAEKYFTAGYERILIGGVGHFPQRENPDRTAGHILDHLRRNA